MSVYGKKHSRNFHQFADSVAGQSQRRDDLVRETLQRAGLSRDLRGYTGAERDRAASETAARLEGSALRRFIMEEPSSPTTTEPGETAFSPAWMARRGYEPSVSDEQRS